MKIKKISMSKLLKMIHVLHTLRAELGISLVVFTSCMVIQDYKDIQRILVVGILAMLAGVIIKYLNTLYMKQLATKKGSKQRYTYLDKGGNPSIKVEDLPDIIQYLYELEEDKNGR